MTMPRSERASSGVGSVHISSSRLINYFAGRGPELLAASYVVLVIYTGLLPFLPRVVPLPDWAGRFLGLSLVSSGLRDAISNVILYVPLGVLLQICHRRGGLGIVRRFALTVLVAVLVSLTVEFGQQFIEQRDPSWVDVVANFCGAAFGALWAGLVHGLLRGIYGATVRRLAGEPWSVAANALVLVLVFHAIFPLNSPLRAKRVYRSVTRSYVLPFEHFGQLEAAEDYAWRNLSPSAALRIRRASLDLWADLLAASVAYLLLAGLITISLRREYGFGRLASLSLTIWSCALLAFVCLILQLLCNSRSADVTVVLFQIGCAVIGASVALSPNGALWRMGRGLGAVRFWSLLLAVQMGYIAYRGLVPFDFQWSGWGGWLSFSWLPFGASLRSSLPVAISELSAVALRFGILAVLLSLSWGDLVARRLGATVARVAGVVLVLGLVLELGQFLLPSRSPDLTTPLLAVLGAGAAVVIHRWVIDLGLAAGGRKGAGRARGERGPAGGGSGVPAEGKRASRPLVHQV